MKNRIVVIFILLLTIQYSFAQNKEEELFLTIVSDSAEPKGGRDAFNNYVKKHLRYPGRFCIEGKVFIQFIVEKDGSLSNYKVVKGIHPDADENALDIFENYNQDESAPRWIPAQHNREIVRQKIVVPIRFKL